MGVRIAVRFAHVSRAAAQARTAAQSALAMHMSSPHVAVNVGHGNASLQAGRVAESTATPFVGHKHDELDDGTLRSTGATRQYPSSTLSSLSKPNYVTLLDTEPRVTVAPGLQK